MLSADRPLRPIARTAILMATILLAAAPSAHAQESAPRWLGADGEPLPFRSHDEVLEFLAEAWVVSSKRLSSGSNRPYKLLLERDGVRANAIFREVDETKRGSHSAAERLFPSYRDSYLFEVAAYEMNRLLGLDNVPPARLYRWRGRDGSIQLWVEHARSEGDRMEAGDKPDDPARWHQQKITMRIFDNLIYNFDRNHGNQLVDVTGKLWFIDHTRSFKPTPWLPSKESIVVIDASLWRHLRDLDPYRVRKKLSPFLTEPQLKALLKRHSLLVEHILGEIDRRGERQVVLGRTTAPELRPTTDRIEPTPDSTTDGAAPAEPAGR